MNPIIRFNDPRLPVLTEDDLNEETFIPGSGTKDGHFPGRVFAKSKYGVDKIDYLPIADDPDMVDGYMVVKTPEGPKKYPAGLVATGGSIGDAVNQWMDDHPETRALIDDNSITNNKLVLGTLEFVTSDMFGAKGDGATDDTEAIRNFLNYPCGIKVFRPGTYNVNGVIAEEMKNCVIYGNGAKINMKNTNCDNRAENGSQFVISNGFAFPNANFDNGFIEIYDLEIDGNADEVVIENPTTDAWYLTCLRLINYKSVYLKNVYVHDSFTGAGIALSSCDISVAEGCVAENIGIAAWTPEYVDFVSFPNYCWDAICCGGWFYSSTAEENVYTKQSVHVVRDCKVKNVAGCFGSSRNSLYAEWSGNVIENVYGYGIEDGRKGISGENTTFKKVFKNNYMLNCGNMFSIVEADDPTQRLNLEISGNNCVNVYGTPEHKFATTASNTLVLLSETNMSGGYVDFTFRDNYVQYASDADVSDKVPSVTCSGLSLQYTGNYTIENNTFECDVANHVENLFFALSRNAKLTVKNNRINGTTTNNTPCFVSAQYGPGASSLVFDGNSIDIACTAAYTSALIIPIFDNIAIELVNNWSKCNLALVTGRVTITTPKRLVIKGNETASNYVFFVRRDTAYSLDFSSMVVNGNVGGLSFNITDGNILHASNAIVTDNIGGVYIDESDNFDAIQVDDNIYGIVTPPLLPNTLRFQFSDATFEPTTEGAAGTWTRVSRSPNVWDWTYNSNNWNEQFKDAFKDAGNLVSVIGAGYTKGVARVVRMFSGCTSLVSCYAFDTSNVVFFEALFSGCTGLTSAPAFNTGKGQSLFGMFNGCTSITEVPLLNTSVATTVGSIFNNCVNVESGALALYTQMSTQTTPPSTHTNAFNNCGRDTVSGAAELAQIPSSWGGTGA